MKTLTIKTTVRKSTVTTTIGDPRAVPGDYIGASLQIRRVNNIPECVSSDRVLAAFKNTIDASFFFKTGQRLEFNYDELGGGKVIK